MPDLNQQLFTSLVALIQDQLRQPYGIINLVITAVLIVCTFAIIISILINFIEASPSQNTLKEKRSPVATASMTGFFVLLYFLIKNKIGVIIFGHFLINNLLIILGLVVIIIGTIFNIRGRLFLGRNWANQIKIYRHQTLITAGPFSIVRHPLYASLIWIITGIGLIYQHWPTLLLNLFIFTPVMYYRAKQEEQLLSKYFQDYHRYSQKVSMFIPHLF